MPVRTALFSYDAEDDEEYSFARGDQLVLCRSRSNSLHRSSTSEISERDHENTFKLENIHKFRTKSGDSNTKSTQNNSMPKDEWIRMKRLGSLSNGGYIPRTFLQSVENTYVYSLQNYDAQLEDELSFLKFEKIEIVSKSIVPDEGYALGRLITGEIGVFPLFMTQIDKPTELVYLEEKDLDDCFEPEVKKCQKLEKMGVKKTISAPVKMQTEIDDEREDSDGGFELGLVPRKNKKGKKERRTVKDLAKMFETVILEN